MKRILLLITTAVLIAFAQTQAVTLTAGSSAHAVVTVCANALCTGGLTMRQFKAQVNTNTASSWRLVYSGTTALALVQASGYTYTAYSRYVGTSQADCIAYATANGIAIPDALLATQIP